MLLYAFCLILIAKLAVCGFGYHLSQSEGFFFLLDKNEQIKNTLSCYSEVPQGSIQDPLLFNIYFCNILFDMLNCDVRTLIPRIILI